MGTEEKEEEEEDGEDMEDEKDPMAEDFSNIKVPLSYSVVDPNTDLILAQFGSVSRFMSSILKQKFKNNF